MFRSGILNVGGLLSTSRRNHGAALRRSAAAVCSAEWLEERRLLSAYYSNGSSLLAGDGSAATPWNSLYAVSIYTGFQPGDVVYLSGTFTNQNMFLEAPAKGITLTSADPNNPATIAESSSYSFTNAIQVNTSGVTISNLNMVGPGITSNSNSYYAILFDNLGSTPLVGATVDHVNESGFVFGGLEFHGNTSGFTNVTVTNSNFSNNQVSGLILASLTSSPIYSNVLISNCVASYNAGFANYFNANNKNASENAGNGGIFIASVNGGSVTHCTAIGNCYKSNAACGIWAHDCNAIIFQYSEVADTITTTSGLDGNGFDFDTNVTNSIMQYDYSHGNDGNGLYMCGVGGVKDDSNDTIRYCVSDDDGLKGNSSLALYSASGKVTNANIYNNTILATETGARGGICIEGQSPAITAACTANFLNNVVYVNAAGTTSGGRALDCSGFTPSTANLKFQGNDFYTTGWATSKFKVQWGPTNVPANTYTALTGTAGWTSTGEEKNGSSVIGLNVDPLFVSEAISDLAISNVGNLALGVTSTLRNAGQSLTAAPYNTSTPYINGAPYNLAGTAWNGVGTQDYFGNPIVGNSTNNIGAGQTSVLTIKGTPTTGDTITLKEDASLPHTLDVVGTSTITYKGVWSVVFNGSTGAEAITFDYVNGPLTDTAGAVSKLGVTFNGGTAANTFTIRKAATNMAMPLSFVPGSNTNNLTVGTGTVTVPAGGQTGIRLATFSNINIASGAVVTFASPTIQSNRTLVSITNGITLAGSSDAWTGTLDLGGNDLNVNGGDLLTLTNQLYQNWNNNGMVTGGIYSATVAADITHLTTLSIIRNSVDGVSAGAILNSSFDSAAAASTDILIKYTYFGDDDLSGTVDGSDYSRIDNAYLTHLTGWYNGDFNFDGTVNGSDYTLIDNAFNTQGATLAAVIARPRAVRTAISSVVTRTLPLTFANSSSTVRDLLYDDLDYVKDHRGRSKLLPQLA